MRKGRWHRIRPHLTIPALILSTAALAAPSASASYHGRIERDLSVERKAHGLPPLTFSHSLSRSSGRYARFLVRTRRFGHLSQLRISGHFRFRAENLAWFRNGGLRPWKVVDAWMNSPGHRAIILSPRYRYVGVSGRRRADGSLVWVAHFGAR